MDKLIHLSDACDLMEKYANRNPDVSSLCYDIRYGLMRLPTISPNEVRGVGEWIWHDKYGWDDSLECSCCAEEFVVYDGEFPGIDSFKFCPNCGARMKGAEDG